jgi:DUF1365 family protein
MPAMGRQDQSRAVTRVFLLPSITSATVAAIHWDALRLRLDGARLVPRSHAATANINTTLASGEGGDYTVPALTSSRKSALVQ